MRLKLSPETQEVQVTIEAPTNYTAGQLKSIIQHGLNQVASGIDVVSIKEEAKIYDNTIAEDEPYPLHRKVLS